MRYEPCALLSSSHTIPSLHITDDRCNFFAWNEVGWCRLFETCHEPEDKNGFTLYGRDRAVTTAATTTEAPSKTTTTTEARESGEDTTTEAPKTTTTTEAQDEEGEDTTTEAPRETTTTTEAEDGQDEDTTTEAPSKTTTTTEAQDGQGEDTTTEAPKPTTTTARPTTTDQPETSTPTFTLYADDSWCDGGSTFASTSGMWGKDHTYEECSSLCATVDDCLYFGVSKKGHCRLYSACVELTDASGNRVWARDV